MAPWAFMPVAMSTTDAPTRAGLPGGPLVTQIPDSAWTRRSSASEPQHVGGNPPKKRRFAVDYRQWKW